MGFDNMEGYYNTLNPYFGSVVGRVANRIGKSRFMIGNQSYNISSNHGNNTLHGGFKGFDKVVWDHDVQDSSVILSYLSRDGEEGFPGDVLTNLKYQLTHKNEFIIEMKATTTKPTIINLSSHSYFNLAGHDKGASELYNHIVQINASHYTDVGDESVPTGELIHVDGTLFNLKLPQKLGDFIHKVPGGGYDHNFCINKGCGKKETNFIARAFHPPTKRALELYSNQPGVQFYTANFLPKINDPEKIIGKCNVPYNKHGSFCFEPQNYPDAINHKNFPNSILKPGDTYHHITYIVFPKPYD